MEKKVPRLGPVKCRVCKKTIDRNIEVEGTDWVQPSRNFYYHKSCYESFKNEKESNDSELWFDRIFDYFSHDLKIPYNFMKCRQQIKEYLKKGYTTKGIYFALKYFYEIKKGDPEKCQGGIGIVPYIYNESAEYWTNQTFRNKEVLNNIIAQIEDREKATPTVYHKTKKQQKPKWDLNDI